MNVDKFDVNGKVVGQIELNEAVFGLTPNKNVIYEAIKNELANRRQGTHDVKTKSEVAYTGAKPFKQKGTGRARAGERSSPVWVGGGIAFGPTPRDHSYKLPKKVKKSAYKSLMSLKFSSNSLKVVEEFKLDSGKTKDFKVILNSLGLDKKVVFVLDDIADSELIKRAGRNLPNVKCLSYNRMNCHALYYTDMVVVSSNAAQKLNVFLAS